MSYELIIFTKFHNDWTKIVDFFINGHFFEPLQFFLTQTLFHHKNLRFPGAGTIKLEMASSLMELSVGGGGQTRLSIMSTLRALGIVDIGGGSVKKRRIMTTRAGDSKY